MSYGIIRVRNLSAADIAPTDIHNGRHYEEHGLTPPPNIVGNGENNFYYYSGGHDNIKDALEARLKETGVKVRSNSVVALEYVVTLSPDAMDVICDERIVQLMKEDPDLGEKIKELSANGSNSYPAKGILSKLKDFIVQKHGQENIISLAYHLDESNPHAHIVVTPIAKKEVKWRNKNGQGTRNELRLCARDFTSGKEKLRQLQTEYFEFVRENIGRRFPHVEFRRGVDARERRARKEFYSKMTSYVLAPLSEDLRKLNLRAKLGVLSHEKVLNELQHLERKKASITSNIEVKAKKDLEKYKQNAEWKKQTKNFGLGR